MLKKNNIKTRNAKRTQYLNKAQYTKQQYQNIDYGKTKQQKIKMFKQAHNTKHIQKHY